MGLALDLVDGAAFWSLVCAAASLLYVGHWMVGSRPGLKQAGAYVGVGAFLLYGVHQVRMLGSAAEADVLPIALRSLAVGGLMLGLSWLVFPLLDGLRRAGDSAHRRLRRMREGFVSWQKRRRDEREQQSLWQEYERSAPTREESRREAEERRRRDEEHRRESQRRREQARLECELFYDRHAAVLRKRFPRERLCEHFKQYMHDGYDAAVVEDRAQKLLTILEEIAAQVQPRTTQFDSLAAIASQFDEKRREIETLGYDDETKDSLLRAINKQEDDAIQKFLQA